MIIDEISLNNFGVYLGNQRIHLTPVSPEKTVILFGGLNGAGKTTLLDAFLLSLFGKFANCSSRGHLGYEDFLQRSIHKAANPKTGAGIEIRFRNVSGGVEHQYSVLRKWKMSGTRVKESVSIEKDGIYDSVMTESWEEHVHSFIPLQISNLFFFDGEKVKELADLKKSAELLSTGIHSLLGLNLVNRLATDLVVLERRKNESLKNNDDYQQIETDKAEIKTLEAEREESVQKLGAIQNKIDRLKLKLQEYEDRFRLEGGELYENRGQLEDEEKCLWEEIRGIEDGLRETAAGAAPLLLVKPLLSSIEEQGRLEELVFQSELVKDILCKRDENLIKILRSRRFAKKSVDVIETILAEDRKKFNTAEDVKLYLKLNDEDKENVTLLIKSVLPEIESEVGTLLDDLHEKRSALEDVERKLAMIPDEDAVKTLINEITAIQKEIGERLERLKKEKAEYERLSKEIDFKRSKLIRWIDSAVEDAFEQEDITRVIHHSRRVRRTLDTFREALVRRHIERIKGFVLKSYRQLFRKENLINDIKIDPETFSLEIIGSNGRLISPDILSAGERQLLAVSLLWGLARASGRSLPAVIDTPLGRLDASHRTRLIEQYFPFASHQVILLSTDEEISKAYFKKLKPWVGRSYRLCFDEKKEATSVKEGYFW